MIPIELDFEKEEKGNEEALNEIARVKQLIIDFLKRRIKVRHSPVKKFMIFPRLNRRKYAFIVS